MVPLPQYFNTEMKIGECQPNPKALHILQSNVHQLWQWQHKGHGQLGHEMHNYINSTSNICRPVVF